VGVKGPKKNRVYPEAKTGEGPRREAGNEEKEQERYEGKPKKKRKGDPGTLNPIVVEQTTRFDVQPSIRRRVKALRDYRGGSGSDPGRPSQEGNE